MRAQVVLKPAESKYLISKAVVSMDVVKKALAGGTIVLHPSSSTYFIVKEITGEEPLTRHWVPGCILPQGLCVEANTQEIRPAFDEPGKKFTADGFPYKWVIKNRKLSSGIPLGTILEEMNSEDVYIKGCNALDIEGNAGVLFGHDGGGTIARVMKEQKKKGFHVILPVGLEKLIPVSILEAAKATARNDQFDYGMGMTCGLFPVSGGTTVTEIKAIEILSGARAVPVASGGLSGAEGAVVLVIEGEKEQVNKAIEYVEQCKGAKIPQARALPCHLCTSKDCRFPVQEKPWSLRRSV
jgi:hypothetical protein